MKLFYSIFAFFFIQILFSQNAIIKGNTIEETTGKPLPGVTVKIKDTSFSTISDSEGNFIIRGVAIGKFNLQFSAFTFETKVISDVETNNNETTNLIVSLSKNNSLDEVVVKTTKAKTESLKSLLTLQKNSIRVSDGISAETIKRTPDRTTSDVLKRISGASVQDNKFVIIRGLNDRYNASYLNGAPLPSSEPDRKAFSFDIFPANMIDNLVIYKTASPDLPGEFGGGVIEINTKAAPDKNFETIAIGSGYNTITTGKNEKYYNGGKKDWIGIDDGTRALPNSFPSTAVMQNLQKINNESSVLKLAELSKSYQTDWNLYNKKFSPNRNLQYTIGKHFKLKGAESIGLLVSMSHNKSNNYNQTNIKSYESPGVLVKNLINERFSEQVLFGVIANASLKLNSNTSFSFKNLYSINSNNQVIDRNGAINQESDPLQIHTTARLFTSNRIYAGQINGEHFLSINKLRISWVGSYSKVERSTPRDRRNTYTYTKFDDGTVSPESAYFSINTVGGDSPGSIYISKNNEDIYSTKIDVNKKIKFSKSFSTDIKVGIFTQSRFRVFNARQLGYTPFKGNVDGVNYGDNTFQGSISSQTNSTIFNSENMGILGPRKSGLTLFDGTKGNDSYTATSKINATYLMFDNSFYKFRLVWGARIENYSQTLDSKSDTGTPVKVNDSNLDFLPSMNLIFAATKKQNIRLSFSKTLNRPEFRELAPFLFYDPETQFNTEGSPDLKTAIILNADLRYEIFPGKGQLFSLSAFYKNFENPVELQALANNSNKYRNAKSGTNRGIEIEYRILLSSIFGTEKTKFLDDLTLYTNLAIIRSKVDISNLVTSSTLENIPLQGQSPYVFNAGIQYMNKELGWSTSANLNRIGNRIAIHGNQTPSGGTPALWEKSRTFLDLQLAKSFMKNKLELKFNIQNVLAQDLIFYLNNDIGNTDKITGYKATINSIFTSDRQNKNGFDEKEDDVFWKTKYGKTFSLSINYSF
jgi:Outer membrane protein beta-barrel family/CarboxypepD_reg-like domain/TonB-dependent Receptor Plug Domain